MHANCFEKNVINNKHVAYRFTRDLYLCTCFNLLKTIIRSPLQIALFENIVKKKKKEESFQVSSHHYISDF